MRIVVCRATASGRKSRPPRSTCSKLPRRDLSLATFPESVGAGKIKIAGEAMRLAELMALMDKFPDVRDVEPTISPQSRKAVVGTLRFAHPAI